MKHFNFTEIRLLSIILVLIALMLLCACNSDTTDTDVVTTDTQQTEQTEPYVAPDDGKLRIFSNGEYRCNIIRPENASDAELALYVKVRNMLKEITGVMPPIATDFLAYNESYDPNEFAIVIGLSKHDEATKLYSELNYSEFRAELVNKKYVIGFHDIDTANTALETLRSYFTKNYKNGELILTEDWNFSYSEDVLLENIPNYEGGYFSGVYLGAYDMQTVVIHNTNADEYKAYLEKLSNSDFKYYTDNAIGKNLFATYHNDDYILTAMFFDNIDEVRITMEHTGNYDLPTLEEENIYTVTNEQSTITQIGLEESAGIQNGMSYIVKLADGSFIVFDGGTVNARDQFVEVISSLADDPENITIAAWIITHAHGDHMGLILDVLYNQKYAHLFNVEQIIWSKISERQLEHLNAGNMDYIDKMLSKLEGTKIVTAHPGQVFYIRNAVYTVYATVEMVEPFTLSNLNDACVVGRLEIDGRSFFFPGDSHPVETDVLTAVYNYDMKSDAVQVIHHGYQGGNAAFYSMVDPLTVFWPLGMKNYSTAESPNTPMKEWSYSSWLFSDEAKVENIYVAGSEVLTLIIKDLPSHSDTVSE
jgi:beta-lactamase superfamily II metal-dependent hydrolase